MNFTEAVSSVFSKFITFDGRARRAEYWYYALFVFIISLITGFLGSLISNVVSLVLFIPGISVCVRRLHDIGKSGLWLLVAFIPLVGAIVLLVFYLTDSQPGTNQYGPNPKEDSIF